MVLSNINIKNKRLPDTPGVYFFLDKKGTVIYVGKATSLKHRVSSYFYKAHNTRLAELVGKIKKIDYIQTPTVIEALVLEANKIKELKPRYNILLKDDKSFNYLVITNEDFPRPLLMRGHKLEHEGIKPFSKILSVAAKKKYLAVYGPYPSSNALKKALDLIRKTIPWSTCAPQKKVSFDAKYKNNSGGRACFDFHIGKCPGVCTGKILKKDYRQIIKNLMMFFEGNKKGLVRSLRAQMRRAAARENFEAAARLKYQLIALKHIQEVALISKEDADLPFSSVSASSFLNINNRLEAYDISNISGTSAVGSMIVFEDQKPAKSKYRTFKIKTVQGINDVAMMEEVLRRRLARAQTQPNSWPLPALFIIDGGMGQVARVHAVLAEFGFDIPIVGIAKGFDRKQDQLVYDRKNSELSRTTIAYKQTLQYARDEAHRFAVAYHRKLRKGAL